MPRTTAGLTAAGQQSYVSVLGQNFVGLNITGTWVGTIAFEQTFDGVKWLPLSLQVYPGGTANAPVSSVTSTGTNVNAFYYAAVPAGNGTSNVSLPVAVRARQSAYTSGTALVTMQSSTDNGYIDASLTPAQININQLSTAATAQTVTVAANTNHAWRLKALQVSVSDTITAAKKVVVKDGTTVLVTAYLPVITGGGPPGVVIALPPEGIVTRINSALVIVVDALDATIISSVNATIGAA